MGNIGSGNAALGISSCWPDDAQMTRNALCQHVSVQPHLFRAYFFIAAFIAVIAVFITVYTMNTTRLPKPFL
jgi:F0F1-type ATP synthase membrane subunit c/vacuolar-type H+-ATPase subunit K